MFQQMQLDVIRHGQTLISEVVRRKAEERTREEAERAKREEEGRKAREEA